MNAVSDYAYPSIREDGMEQCVRCGELFADADNPSMELNATAGPVRRASDGTEYQTVVDSPPGTALMHPECHADAETERKAEENTSLEDYQDD